MRLETLTLRGFMTAFAGKQVEINFRDLPDGLIALTGDNGSGKTTLLEAAPAGLYRQMMSRDGDLKTYAMDRDSCIETSWLMDDKWYQARLTVDGIKGGASAALFESAIDAVRPLNDGKVSTYDGAVAKVFPPLHVFKASAFAAQNKSGSFVKASKKERRDIFASFLNLDRLVKMSETAKLAGAEVDKVRTRVLADVQLLERETTEAIVDGLQRQAIGLEDERACQESRLQLRTNDILQLEQRLALLSDQVTAAAAAQQRVTHLAEVLAGRRRELQARVDVDKQAAAAEMAELRQLERAHADLLQVIDARATQAATRDAAELRTLANELAATLTDIDTKIAGNQQIQAMADDIRKAVATIQDQTPAIERLRNELEHLRATERQLARRQAENEQLIASFTKPRAELDRAKADAALLEHVPCGGVDQFAGCQFLVNAKEAEARIEELEATVAGMVGALKTREGLAGEIIRAADAIDAATKAVAGVDAVIRQAQPTAAYADKLAAADARVEELTRLRADAVEVAARSTARAKTRHAEATDQRQRERVRLDGDLAQAKGLLATRISDRIAAATQALDALAGAATTAEVEHAAAVLELQRVTDGSTAAAQLQADLILLRADRDAAVTAIATAASDAAAVRRRLEVLQEQAARLGVLRSRLAKLDTELVEWQLLQRALDRDGLPALETDQAGPEISATTNRILQDCFESRFSVELVTQVARADGKGMKDEFTLLVTDNHTGDIRDISDLSGGEEIIVAEAFMNSIAIFVNDRSQTPMRTAFRDETTGALTKENTQRYLRMLRKVQELGGFRQILFISHDPDAQVLADAQIRVAGGAVTIARPPYAEAA